MHCFSIKLPLFWSYLAVTIRAYYQSLQSALHTPRIVDTKERKRHLCTIEMAVGHQKDMLAIDNCVVGDQGSGS